MKKIIKNLRKFKTKISTFVIIDLRDNKTWNFKKLSCSMMLNYYYLRSIRIIYETYYRLKTYIKIYF